MDTSYFIFRTNCVIGDTLRVENSRNYNSNPNLKYAYYVAEEFSPNKLIFWGIYGILDYLPHYFIWIDSLGTSEGGVEYQAMQEFEGHRWLTGSCRDGNVVYGPSKYVGNLCTPESIRYLYASVDERDQQKMKFTVFPNPASSQFYISGNQEAEIHITNTLGQCFVMHHSSDKTTIENLDAGVYFIRIIQDGVSELHKVIVE